MNTYANAYTSEYCDLGSWRVEENLYNGQE
jgi:hypothetical protein